MGLFTNDTPKRVTEREMDDIMRRLYGKLDEDERIEVEKLFRADLAEDGREAGVTQAEFDAALRWLAENESKHELEADDIELIKTYFAEHLRD